MNTMELEQRYTSGCYSKRGITIVRGEGARIWDDAGTEYIDCVAGHGVAIVGHCNPAVVEAICRQAQTLITCPEIFYNDVRAQLLEKLVSISPAGLMRAMLVNSGTEAVEGALKLARLSTGRPGIVATQRVFHGRTMGALSATWDPHYRKPFEPLLPGVQHVPYGNLDQLRDAVTEETAAVILEVVQGEGGVNPGDGEYLRGAEALCHDRGALLIIDEVQTGFGRTGRMFACEHHGLHPDLMAVAKGIAGGVPMGALLLGDSIQNVSPGVHVTTFGGNPLACAAAVASLNIFTEERVVEGLAGKIKRFSQGLQPIAKLGHVGEIRQRGFMVGIELVADKKTKELYPPGARIGHRVILEARKRGLIIRPLGDVIVLMPPLCITNEEIDRLCEITLDSIRAVVGD